MNAPSETAVSGGAFPRPSRWRALVATLVVLLTVALLGIAPATATWSIVAVDPDSGDVGVAIASCVPGIYLGDLGQPLEPVVLVPLVGAGVSQAALNSDAPPEIERLLTAGAAADAVIAALVEPSFDEESAERQHAVVRLDGSVAAFTGDANQSVAGDQTAPFLSVQGNILVSDAVISNAVASFESTTGDLPTRLVAALVAGAEAGGDARCDDQTALFAQVVVAGPDDDPAEPAVLLTVAVASDDEQNPVLLLSEGFERGERRWVAGPGFVEQYGPSIALIGLAVFVVVGVFVAVRRRRR